MSDEAKLKTIDDNCGSKASSYGENTKVPLKFYLNFILFYYKIIHKI